MLYAKVTYLNKGTDKDKEFLAVCGYKLNDVIEVSNVDMRGFHTSIRDRYGRIFNSVHFDFYEDKECLTKVDIYSNPKYNPYTGNKKN